MSVVSDIIDEYYYEPADELTADCIHVDILEKCPGNYTLTVGFNDGQAVANFDFVDEEDALAFKLKYL